MGVEMRRPPAVGHHEADGQGADAAQELVADHDPRLGHARRQVELPADREPAFDQALPKPAVHDDALVEALGLAGVAMGGRDAEAQDHARTLFAAQVREAARVRLHREDGPHGSRRPPVEGVGHGAKGDRVGVVGGRQGSRDVGGHSRRPARAGLRLVLACRVRLRGGPGFRGRRDLGAGPQRVALAGAHLEARAA